MVGEAEGEYGLGATYLGQGDLAKAAEYFAAMKKLPGGAPWHPHVLDAEYGLALAAEQAGDPDGLAQQTYAKLKQSALAGITLQANATIGYRRLLEKAGHGVAPAPPGTLEHPAPYNQQAHTPSAPPEPA